MTAANPAGPTLVLGGVRSGKSAFAEGLIGALGLPVFYLATGLPVDEEFAQRIRRHQQSRPGDWVTVEGPLNPAAALETALPDDGGKCAVLVDSIDTWLSNLLLEHEAMPSPELETLAMSRLDTLLEMGRRSSMEMVLVSSEVGLSLVAPTQLGRRFQDLLGLVNQRAAAAANDVCLVVAGIPLQIKAGRGPHEQAPTTVYNGPHMA